MERISTLAGLVMLAEGARPLIPVRVVHGFSRREAATEDDAACDAAAHTTGEAPVHLLSAIRKLIAKRETAQAIGDDCQGSAAISARKSSMAQVARASHHRRAGQPPAMIVLAGALLLSGLAGWPACAGDRSSAGAGRAGGRSADGGTEIIESLERGADPRFAQRNALLALFGTADSLAQRDRYDEAIMAFAAVDHKAVILYDRAREAYMALAGPSGKKQWQAFMEYLGGVMQDARAAAQTLRGIRDTALWDSQSKRCIDVAHRIAEHLSPDSLPIALRSLDEADSLLRQIVIRSSANADTLSAYRNYADAFTFRQEQAIQRLSFIGRLRGHLECVASIHEQYAHVDSLWSQTRAACLERNFPRADTLLAQRVIEITSLLADSLVLADSTQTDRLKGALLDNEAALTRIRDERQGARTIPVTDKNYPMRTSALLGSLPITRPMEPRLPVALDFNARMDVLRAMNRKAEGLAKTDVVAATQLRWKIYALAGELSRAPEVLSNPFLGKEAVHIGQDATGGITLGDSEQETGRQISAIVHHMFLADQLAEKAEESDASRSVGVRSDSLYVLALQDIARLRERRTLGLEGQAYLARTAGDIQDRREVHAALRRLQNLLKKMDYVKANALIDALLKRKGLDKWEGLEWQLHEQRRMIEPFLPRPGRGAVPQSGFLLPFPGGDPGDPQHLVRSLQAQERNRGRVLAEAGSTMTRLRSGHGRVMRRAGPEARPTDVGATTCSGP